MIAYLYTDGRLKNHKAYAGFESTHDYLMSLNPYIVTNNGELGNIIRDTIENKNSYTVRFKTTIKGHHNECIAFIAPTGLPDVAAVIIYAIDEE